MEVVGCVEELLRAIHSGSSKVSKQISKFKKNTQKWQKKLELCVIPEP